jgi:predicted O-linked N-acetylglucosamine transferase (SPINDLY family)
MSDLKNNYRLALKETDGKPLLEALSTCLDIRKKLEGEGDLELISDLDLDYKIGEFFFNLKIFYKAYISFYRAYQNSYSQSNEVRKVGLLMNLASCACVCGDVEKAYEFCEEAVKIGQHPNSYFYLIYLANHLQNISDTEINALAHNLCKNIFSNTETQLLKETINIKRKKSISSFKKIKIGVLTPHLTQYSGEHILSQTFINMPSKKYELHWFHTGTDVDEISHEIISQSDSYQNLSQQNHFEIASAIAEAEIDILIDTLGLVLHNRLDVFALKPAPVQVSMFGYWLSTGMPEMDYMVGHKNGWKGGAASSAIEKRIEVESFYYMPNKYPIDVKSAPILKNNYVTFGCFNRFPKINSKVLEIWSVILDLIPQSQLTLSNAAYNDDAYQEIIFNFFEKKNIERHRINLIGQISTEEYLKLYNEIDIALDPFPFTGSCTTIDTLWMGTPVITLTSDNRTTQRFSSIFLEACELNDLIAHSERDYIFKAIELAKNPAKIQWCKENLRQRLIDSKIIDLRKSAKEFEEAIDTIVELELKKQKDKDNNLNTIL